MSNKEKYNNVFISSFGISESDLNESLEYNSIPEWDSVGHMSLVSELEDQFGIMLEMDDIIDFSSYGKGIEIISKHGIEF